MCNDVRTEVASGQSNPINDNIEGEGIEKRQFCFNGVPVLRWSCYLNNKMHFLPEQNTQ